LEKIFTGMLPTNTKTFSAKTRRLPDEVDGLPVERINIGCVKVSDKPVVFDTVLGSCISVCMYDPKFRAGGINHFMLPKGADLNNPLSTRYGIHAMELLINNLVKLGASRSRLVVKIFGGGHVLKIINSSGSVPNLNINFINKFLATEKFKVITSDLGGNAPRRILFLPHTGQVFLRRLGEAEADKAAKEEIDFLSDLKTDAIDGGTTIF
jgi:chemotaxis protein CheD